MNRWAAALGLFVSWSVLTAEQRMNLSYPGLWSTLGLIAFLFFVVMLIMGPRKN
ncbi:MULTISPECIES: hypothetical protein [Streptomyces]|nr:MULTISPECIES: hypothetical protein [Streptomyces]